MEKILKKIITLEIYHGADPFGDVRIRVKAFGIVLAIWTYDGRVIK